MKKEVTIPLAEFASRCVALLDEVATTGEEIVVTREGRPLVRVAAEPVRSGRPSLAHYVRSVGDVLSPIDEEWEAEV